MQSATLVNWAVQPDGSVNVTWNDGYGTVFSSVDEAKSYALSMNQDPESARKLMLAWFLARDDTLTNTNLVKGKTLVFDLSAAQPIKVQ